MTVDLSPIDENLLAEIANMHGMPKGAFNVRKDGELVERHSSAYIDISTKTDNPGIDIRIADGTKGETVYIPVIVTKSGDGELVERHSSAYIDISTKTDNPGIDIRIADGTKGETVYIPVIVTKSGLKDVVYNTFYVGENCDITIIAGCGIHNDSHDASEHDGIHSFYLGKNSRVRYVEKHYGEGEGTGARILNPTTNVYMEEGSSCEMEMVQLRGVTSTVRDTNAELGANAKLVLTEKLLTHGNQTAISNMKVELKGEGSSVQVISRSVAQDDSVQVFNPLVIGECACRGHVQCDAIIMGNVKGEGSSVQVISRSVAQDDSVQVFNPLVIGECACRGHVQCDAIIMGNAKVKAIPGIEAASEDAMLVHEAAIGKIAGDQIVKLMTLGLTEEEAEAEILDDFLS